MKEIRVLEGEQLFDLICEREMEGIVAKLRSHASIRRVPSRCGLG